MGGPCVREWRVGFGDLSIKYQEKKMNVKKNK